MIEVKRNWLVVIGSAVFVMTLSAFTTGCRFGNRVEGGGPQQDAVAGHYEMEAFDANFCVTLETGGNLVPVCKEATPDLMSANLKRILTNPINLVWGNRSEGIVALMSKNNADDGSDYILAILQDQSLINNTVYEPGPFVQQTCLETGWVNLLGKIDQSGGATSAGAGFDIRGRITLNLELGSEYDAACAPTFQYLHDCYIDAAQCQMDTATENESWQAEVREFFSSYIQAGALTVDQIPNIRKTSYIVDYK